jgi:hypothetical protein
MGVQTKQNPWRETVVPPAFRPIPVCNFTSGEILDLDWYWVVLADSMGFAFQVRAASPTPATALASLWSFLLFFSTFNLLFGPNGAPGRWQLKPSNLEPKTLNPEPEII